MPEQVMASTAPAKPAARVPARTMAPATPPSAAAPGPRRVAPRAAAPPPPPEPEQAEQDADLDTIAISAMSSVLEANPNGMANIKYRMAVHGAVKAAGYDDTVATQVIDTYFVSDQMLTPMLGRLGYKKVGINIQPA